MLEVRHKSERRFELSRGLKEKRKRDLTLQSHISKQDGKLERQCLLFYVVGLEDNLPSEPGSLGLFCFLL